MRLTKLQKNFVDSINSGITKGIISFFEEFCFFNKNTHGAMMYKEVDIFYISKDLTGNHIKCQEFIILLKYLHENKLIELSPHKSDTTIQFLKTEDGENLAQLDEKLIRIFNEHLENNNDGFLVCIEIIPLQDLYEFINNRYKTIKDKRENFIYRSSKISFWCLIISFLLNVYLITINPQKDRQILKADYNDNAWEAIQEFSINLMINNDQFDSRINELFALNVIGYDSLFSEILKLDSLWKEDAIYFVTQLNTRFINYEDVVDSKLNSKEFANIQINRINSPIHRAVDIIDGIISSRERIFSERNLSISLGGLYVPASTRKIKAFRTELINKINKSEEEIVSNWYSTE